MLEIERKYLISLPFKWYAKAKIAFADKHEIYQSYLCEPGERIRASIKYESDKMLHGVGPTVQYTFTTKKFIRPGVNEEVNLNISNSLFVEKKKLVDPKRFLIEKTRYMIDFDQRKFELDIYKGKLLGLSILEIELKHEKEKFLLPPYFTVVKEVTNDSWYSNYNLSTVEKYGGYGRFET